MNIEITKSDTGYHVKDIEAGTDHCYETRENLSMWLCTVIVPNIGDEVTVKD
jgi:hypothetical protein